ncbi:MAG TPA: glycosyltransferase [Gemmatimonadaceae bacterium]|nr:glycosyltransferase [Gemmatimonadaceae bacterium]
MTSSQPGAPSVTEALFLSDAQLRASPLDLAATVLPPRLRERAEVGVLDITEFFGDTTGGIRTYLRQKAAYVEAHPEFRHVLVLPGSRDAITQSAGVRIYRLKGPMVPRQEPYRFMLATRSNRRIVVHERPDVIEVGSPGLVPWIVRLAARGLGVPVVAFYHSNFPRVFSPWPERAPWWRRTMHDLAWRYARRIDRHFAHTIVCSRFVGDDLRRAGIDRVTQIPLGVDLARYHPGRRGARDEVRARYGLPAGLVAGFVGRFAPEKELDVLLAAWPAVHKATGATLVLIGDGPQRLALERMAGTVDWIRFLPYEKDRERLADLLAALDVFVAPSSNETFGLAPLEAMACGTPVLTADRGGISEQVEASGAGLQFASGDPAALAESAVTLFGMDLAALGVRGRAHAERNHDWDAVFDRIFALYRDVVRTHGSGP